MYLTQRWCHQCFITFSLACNGGMPDGRMLYQCEHMHVQALGTYFWPGHFRVTCS